MFPSPFRDRDTFGKSRYRLSIVIALAFWLLPLLAVLLTSARSAEELSLGHFWGWPNSNHFVENYVAVLDGSRLAGFALNSLIITVPAVVGSVTFAAMAGFALAKHRFNGNRLLLMTFVAGNLVPFQVLMIPVRDLMLTFGLYDTRAALILFHTAFQTGFCTLFMRNFIRELPDAVLDAARMEGAGELRLFWFIVVPLVRPAMAAMAVLVFTFVWNDYFWSLVLVQSDAIRPVTAGLQSLRGMWQTSWELVSAASLLAAMPPVLVFFAMQRHLVAGITLRATAAR